MSLYSLADGEKADCAESAMHVLISVIRALLFSEKLEVCRSNYSPVRKVIATAALRNLIRMEELTYRVVRRVYFPNVG
jgi:hypothetical protein